MAHPIWVKIKGIVNEFFKLGFKGPHIEKDATIDNQVNILANNGIADAIAKVATVKTKQIELSDGDANKTTITMPDGALVDLNFKLPTTDGNYGDALTTDGDGNLSWSNSGGSADLTTHDYDLVFNTASPLNLLNMLDLHRIARVIIDVTTAFDGGSNMDLSIGIAGNLEKFAAKKDIDLKNIGTYVIDVELIQTPAAQMIATYTADGATVGAAKIIVWSSKPD